MTHGAPLVRFGVGICPRPGCRGNRILTAGRPNTPVGSPPVGNNGNAEAFALHAKRSASFDLGSSDGTQRGNRSGAAYVRDATGSNGPPQRPRGMRRVARRRNRCRNKAPSRRRAPRPPTRERSRSATNWRDPRACSARPQELTRKFVHQRLRRAICRSFLRPAALAAIRRSGRNKSGVAADLKQQHPKIWK
jgi:hypothetical protein